ncbi:NAD-dependent epimerase/dehydratase family protein [Lichenicoccus sp.]|uniref:NAD-dependent epimerase/dehydratase family protein n=1 Tax=Lichenicoccus sp. TaxID=2781899 RepID=UPI003D1507BC
MRAAPLVALTGGTGFLGRHLATALAARGFRLRILTRREASHPLWRDLTADLVTGDLDDAPALGRLVQGCDIVIHAAGLIKARSRREFLSVNRDGAVRLAGATQRHAPGAHLIGISSLAARVPRLSAYAESKRAGERGLAASFSGRLTIIRPPVIYGPWDRATFGIFRAAAKPIVPVPGSPEARIAMIHVEDAAAAIAALAAWNEAPGGSIHALADLRPAGYAPRHILGLAAAALGNNPRFVRLPGSAVRFAGIAASLLARVSGRPGLFSAGKAREMLYPCWGVSAEELLPAMHAAPGIDLPRGFASTVAWYRQTGWLV